MASLILVALLTGACRGDYGFESRVGIVWSTTYHITYQGRADLGDSITRVLAEVGKSLNVFDSTSVVSQINANRRTQADAHFAAVLAGAKKVNHDSEGSFDPTLGPLITAWGFGKGHSATPDTARIDSLLQFVGLDKINISGRRVSKSDPRVQLNLSAIAKGYGCDAVAAMFRRNGVTNYMVEIGGEIRVGGTSPRGGNWAIAIDTPQEDTVTGRSSGAVAVAEFSNAGMATSGNYRNYHEENGVKFGHTLDPATGRPARTDVLSATVIAPTCMEADAYATACMVLGSRRAEAMVSRLGLPALLVTADHKVWMSQAMKKYITF